MSSDNYSHPQPDHYTSNMRESAHATGSSTADRELIARLRSDAAANTEALHQIQQKLDAMPKPKIPRTAGERLDTAEGVTFLFTFIEMLICLFGVLFWFICMAFPGASFDSKMGDAIGPLGIGRFASTLVDFVSALMEMDMPHKMDCDQYRNFAATRHYWKVIVNTLSWVFVAYLFWGNGCIYYRRRIAQLNETRAVKEPDFAGNLD